MKTKYCLLFVISLLGFQQLKSQELSEEDFKMMSEFAYEMCTSIFKDKNYIYKEGPFVKENFYDPVPTAEQVDELVKLITQTAKLSIEEGEFGGPQLIFSVKYKESQYELFDHLDRVDFEDAQLLYKDGKELKLEGYFQVQKSFEEYQLKGGIDKNTHQASASPSGSATYSFQILTGFDEVKLSKKDIGETFELNNCSFLMVDIIQNQIILEPLCKDEISVKLINFSKENTVYESYDYMTLMEMQEKDSSINIEGSFTQSSQTIDKKMFNIFKKNPKLSLKKFRKMLTSEEIARLEKQESIYLILEHVAPIGENFILFSPIFRQEEVTVQY